MAPETSDEAPGRPSQETATISTLLPTPGLTSDKSNEPVIEQCPAEEAQERQRNRQNAERQQTESIEEWIAGSTSRRRCRRMMVRQRRPQAGISSDEATCCFCSCLVSLRPLCCGRKPDRDRPTGLRQRQPDASNTPLTEGQLDEHRRRTGEHYRWGWGSTQAVGESSPHQRERNDQSQREPVEHQDRADGSTAPVENPAPAQGTEGIIGLEDAAADNVSVTAPFQHSQSEPTRSKFTQAMAVPQLRSSGSS